MTDTRTTAHGNTVQIGDRVVITQGFLSEPSQRSMGHTGILTRIRAANAYDVRDRDVKVFRVLDPETGVELGGYQVEPSDFDGTTAVDASTLQLDGTQVARIQALAMVREAFGPNLLAEEYVELGQFVMDGTKALAEDILGTAVHAATEVVTTPAQDLGIAPRRSLPDYLKTAPDLDGDEVGLTGYLSDLVISVTNTERVLGGRTALVKGVDRDNLVRWFLEYAQAVGITLED